jgi:hypothetical protein
LRQTETDLEQTIDETTKLQSLGIKMRDIVSIAKILEKEENYKEDLINYMKDYQDIRTVNKNLSTKRDELIAEITHLENEKDSLRAYTNLAGSELFCRFNYYSYVFPVL